MCLLLPGPVRVHRAAEVGGRAEPGAVGGVRRGGGGRLLAQAGAYAAASPRDAGPGSGWCSGPEDEK